MWPCVHVMRCVGSRKRLGCVHQPVLSCNALIIMALSRLACYELYHTSSVVMGGPSEQSYAQPCRYEWCPRLSLSGTYLHARTSLALICDSQTCVDHVVPCRFLARASDRPPSLTRHAPFPSHSQLQDAPYGIVPNNGNYKPPIVGSGTTCSPSG